MFVHTRPISFYIAYISIELGGVGLVRWKAPEDKKRADFPVSKSFAVFGVEWVYRCL